MTEIAFDNSYARLPDMFFARVEPDRVPAPKCLALNESLAQELGIDSAWLRSAEGLSMLSGNGRPSGAEPIAMVYAGHQFGGFSPQLGDGRAALLGEVVATDGTRRDIQLKGSGRTPFSRQGDGKSPLGPVVREYLISEAMHGLGIPATRALAAVATGERVLRETSLAGGVLTRVAASHVRVGTFEYFSAAQQPGAVKQLADYVIERHYPDAQSAPNPYAALLAQVTARQAELISRWMQVGFVHGVMNTDNMQIAGETIDFGPCAFMETFDTAAVFSSIDRQGRYAWGNQPGIGQWNLSRLAETLLPLLAADEAEAVSIAEKAIERFAPAFNASFIGGFRQKLGLLGGGEEGDTTAPEDDILHATFAAMTTGKVDFTLFFRHLTGVAAGREPTALLALFSDSAVGETWLARWRNEAQVEAGQTLSPDRVAAMRRRNPVFIARNHRVEEAIAAAYLEDLGPFERLLRVLERPFEEQTEFAEYERPAREGEVVEQTFCGT